MDALQIVDTLQHLVGHFLQSCSDESGLLGLQCHGGLYTFVSDRGNIAAVDVNTVGGRRGLLDRVLRKEVDPSPR